MQYATPCQSCGHDHTLASDEARRVPGGVLLVFTCAECGAHNEVAE